MRFFRIFRTPLISGFIVLFCSIGTYSQQTATVGNSSISGIVYDKQRNTYSDLDVELLNDYYQTIRRARTDSMGKYEFSGLGDGRYTVRVRAFRYDFEDQEQATEINTISITGTQGSTFIPLDFVLSPKSGGLAESETGVVFYQDIPKEAQKLYEKAMADFKAKKNKDGLLRLNDAIKIFPEYFNALFKAGKELVVLGRFQDAAPFFLKSSEVNPKHASSFFMLGYCLQQMGRDYVKAAIVSLNQAYLLAPNSIAVLTELGKAERIDSRFSEAEKHLLQAKKLSKNTSPDVHKELAQLYGNDLKKFGLAADELELYLKAIKISKDEEKQMKKTISDLREKAKTQPTS